MPENPVKVAAHLDIGAVPEIKTPQAIGASADRLHRRRIGLHHMAFIRGVYEGLDIGALAEQYLGTLGDRRRVKSTLRWLVEELSNAARKRGDSAGARLLRLPTAKLADTPFDATVIHTWQDDTRLQPGGAIRTGDRATPLSKPTIPLQGTVRQTSMVPASVSVMPGDAPTHVFASLDDFRETHDPDGVYSEVELIALYEEARLKAGRGASTFAVSTARLVDDTTGMQTPSALLATVPDMALKKASVIADRAVRREARNQRLRARRREVLDRLEATLVEPPRLHHFIGDWIDPVLARRLEAVDVKTVGDLLSMINRRGFRWYRDVPRIGLRAAQRLQDWLSMNAVDLGARIARHAATPRRQWSPNVDAARRVTSDRLAAIEYFTPSDALVAADRDMLIRVLDRYKQSASTYRCFRLQAERLLLWTALIRQTTLGQLRVIDVEAYFAFMRAPDSEWCGPKVERGLPTWRPFEGPASDASVRIARRTLKVLFGHLALAGSVRHGLFDSLLPSIKPVAQSEIEHTRTDVVSAIPQSAKAWCDIGASMASTSSSRRPPLAIHVARMRLLAHVVAVTGLRMSEVATLRVRDIDALIQQDMPVVRATTLVTARRGRQRCRYPKADACRVQLSPGVQATSLSIETLRCALSDYLALREAQSGSVSPDAWLFLRHTAAGFDPQSAAVPAGTLVRVLARFAATMHAHGAMVATTGTS